MVDIACQFFPDPAAMAEAASGYIAAALDKAIAARGIASLVLAGGKTPRLTYRKLATTNIDWSRVHFFWGDDRWFPPEHPESNYHLAKEELLDSISICPQNIHPLVATGNQTLESAADDYEKKITVFWDSIPVLDQRETKAAGGFFDVTLLGMGADGHTASLFPGHSLLHDTKRLVGAVVQPMGNPPVPRLTMTIRALSRSGYVFFLISGVEKKLLLEKMIGSVNPSVFPAALITALQEIRWFVSETS
jgi:6-phosphogluconolactonase